jgi:hypothetical protein
VPQQSDLSLYLELSAPLTCKSFAFVASQQTVAFRLANLFDTFSSPVSVNSSLEQTTIENKKDSTKVSEGEKSNVYLNIFNRYRLANKEYKF